MFARFVIPAMICASAAVAADAPPTVKLTVPAEFSTSVSVKRYRKGQDLLNSPPFHLITVAAMTEYSGHLGPRISDMARSHSWSVHVYRRHSEKVAAAFASATDGYQANLNEEPEFLGVDERSYMYARFERKRFPWGNAVSFFSQFTQDTGVYVPHNGHLTYEVWGVTRDHKFTVVAHASVTHPKLADWGPKVRDAESIAALKRDRDYKLVETCSPDQFTPNLAAFDRMLESLAVR